LSIYEYSKIGAFPDAAPAPSTGCDGPLGPPGRGAALHWRLSTRAIPKEAAPLAAHPPQDPVVVCTPNEDYAIGAAVALYSAQRNLDPARRMRLFLVDGGLRPGTRRQLQRILDPERVDVRWVDPQWHKLRDLPLSEHLLPVIYLRLVLPELLPADLERFIYLDVDLVVNGDLGELWDQELGDRLVLAVQDFGFPYVDAERALENFEACKPHLWGVRGVENWQELGLDPRAKYFNAGIQLVDLAGWRREKIGERMIRCLHENREHAALADQYALNVVLAGRIGELDPRWNTTLALFMYPSPPESPWDAATWERLTSDPQVVHFVGRWKPWYWGRRRARHPWRAHFDRYYDELAWPLWRRWRWTLLPVTREWLQKRRRRARKAWASGTRRLGRAGRALRGRAGALARGLGMGRRG
jgi:lipopolysaccharide biosynthesis glycosyltransferase